MESLRDILKKIPPGSQTQSTDESAGAEPGRLAAEVCPICHGAGFFRSGKPPGDPDFARLIPCSCTRARFEARRLARLQKYSNLGPLSRFTFDNLAPLGNRPDAPSQERFRKAVEACKKYADQPEGWLVLLGPHGCGKTHLAAAIANYRLAQSKPAVFILVPELLDHLRATYRPESEVSYDELFQQVKSSPMLVLDDLGSQVTTPWATEKLHQIINSRFLERLPTVFTSAVPLDELEERLRTRLGDPELSRVLLLEDRDSPGLARDDGLQFVQQMTFENFDLKRSELTPEQRTSLQLAFQDAKRFAENPTGWLTLQGGNGCGKTHLAAAIGNYRRVRGLPILFISVPDLIDHLRATFSPQSPVSYDVLFEKVKMTPLLILDDFGQQTSTPWAQDKLYQLMSYRYNARLATVFTTCQRADEIESRMASRLTDAHVNSFDEITATDYRVDHGSPPPRTPYRPQSYRRK